MAESETKEPMYYTITFSPEGKVVYYAEQPVSSLVTKPMDQRSWRYDLFTRKGPQQ